MNKLLLLLPSLASADLIQDSYKEQFYQLSKANFEIITAFLVIFLALFRLFMVLSYHDDTRVKSSNHRSCLHDEGVELGTRKNIRREP